ncbi:MAG: hypothetical protein KF768_02325 [Phycisphaeraceae bacterium]|nr:hypothetical protein [Phycisphaeraceae bacterium]
MSRAARSERPGAAPASAECIRSVLRLSASEDAPERADGPEIGPAPRGSISDRLALAFEGVPTPRLAKLTGFNHETVRRYLSGQNPPLRFVMSVCERFDLNPNWVLLGEGLAWNSSLEMADLSMVPTREVGEEIAARLKKA